MTVYAPDTVEVAVSLLAEHSEATLLAGGTDLMVEVNDGRRRPGGPVIALNRVTELRSWRHDPVSSTVTIGAAVTYSELMTEPLASLLPALADASRTVGSPQIRNAGTLGGNLGTCSPAGDGLPVLSALEAVVEIAGSDGRRSMPVGEFMLGVKRSALAPGEMITAITLPVLTGWQGYAKVGVRNAMVIAVASASLVLDQTGRTVRIALGSVGPTVLRCPAAETHFADALDWDSLSASADAVRRFGELVGEASTPITDHRSTAEYRRHAVAVLSGRLARRASKGVAA